MTVMPELVVASQNRDEPYLTMYELIKFLPCKVTEATLLRWIRGGATCRGGRVYLKYIRVGRRIYSTRTYLQKFLDEMASANAAPRPSAKTPSPGLKHGLRIPSHEEAERRLKGRGK